MAKKALVNKQQRKPKFKVRAYTRCTASSACAESACGNWRMPANCRACRRAAGK